MSQSPQPLCRRRAGKRPGRDVRSISPSPLQPELLLACGFQTTVLQVEHELRESLTSHLQTGTELSWGLEERQAGGCCKAAPWPLRCHETLISPSFPAPSHCPAGPGSNKGKPFPFPVMRCNGLKRSQLWSSHLQPLGPYQGQTNPHRREAKTRESHLLNPPGSNTRILLSFLWPLTASPCRAVRGNLKLGC